MFVLSPGTSRDQRLLTSHKTDKNSLIFSFRGDPFDEEIVFSDPAQATEQPPRQALYTEVVELEKAASISQMLTQPDFQHSQTWCVSTARLHLSCGKLGKVYLP